MALMKFREENHVKWMGVRPAHDGTQVLAHTTGVGGTAPILYTVPAGMTLFITHLCVSFYAAGAGTWHARVNPGGVSVYLAMGLVIAGSQLAPIPLNYWPPIELEETRTLSLVLGAGMGSTYLCMHGWVE